MDCFQLCVVSLRQVSRQFLVLTFQVDTVRNEFSDTGSRFFDRDDRAIISLFIFSTDRNWEHDYNQQTFQYFLFKQNEKLETFQNIFDKK